jgi:hypothetical protein
MENNVSVRFVVNLLFGSRRQISAGHNYLRVLRVFVVNLACLLSTSAPTPALPTREKKAASPVET